MTSRVLCGLALVGCSALLAGPEAARDGKGPGADDGKTFRLTLRSRAESPKGSGVDRVTTRTVEWSAARTAVVVCDMWDRHWCDGATRRVAKMAPRADAVLAAARKKGALIVHCPSDTMDFYKDSPQRRLALAAPAVEPRVPLKRWCPLDPAREAPLPIDDTDGGCDCSPPVRSHKAWSRQIDVLKIEPGDAVAEGPEAYYLMRQRGIENVLVLGVHTNMCVLGRSFSIRQLVGQGLNVVLLRDLTDTMYNPRRPPYVSHFTGTDLVVEHVEKYWCPTVTSADLLGGKPFRFAADRRPHLVLVMSEDEYHTDRTLPEFARRHLGKYFRVSAVHADPKEPNELPGIALLDEADVALISVRRRALPLAQLETVRRFVKAGKPVVAIRTASHAFAPRGDGKTAPGHALWTAFDRDVLGCLYEGHHANDLPTIVKVAAGAAKNPVLTGVPAGPAAFSSSLYKVRPLAAGATELWTGRAGARGANEPVAWTWTRPDGGRVFSTTLGHPDDFRSAAFNRLLLNGTCWAAGLPVPARALALDPIDYAEWQPLEVPGCWEDTTEGRLSAYDGFAWYRAFVKVPDAWDGKDVTLAVEEVDNAHEAFVNGVKVGGCGTLPPNYRDATAEKGSYRVAGKGVKGGSLLVVALRVYDAGGSGGFQGKAPAILCDGRRIDLAGTWQFRTGDRADGATPSDPAAESRRISNVFVEGAGKRDRRDAGGASDR